MALRRIEHHLRDLTPGRAAARLAININRSVRRLSPSSAPAKILLAQFKLLRQIASDICDRRRSQSKIQLCPILPELMLDKVRWNQCSVLAMGWANSFPSGVRQTTACRQGGQGSSSLYASPGISVCMGIFREEDPARNLKPNVLGRYSLALFP